jgi:hypothetical protein
MVKCYSCNNIDHYANDCPNKEEETKSEASGALMVVMGEDDKYYDEDVDRKYDWFGELWFDQGEKHVNPK